MKRWTDQEDQRLKDAYLRFGDDFHKIASSMEGRSKDALRSRIKHLKFLSDIKNE